MSKIATAASFQAIIDGANEKTDFQKALVNAIKALGDSEVIILNLNTAAGTASASIAEYKLQVETLQKTITNLENEVEEKDEQLVSATDTIEELGKQLDLQTKNSDGPIIVKVGDKMKKILGNRFKFKDEPDEFDAKGLSERPDLLQQMLDKNSGALVDAE